MARIKKAAVLAKKTEEQNLKANDQNSSLVQEDFVEEEEKAPETVITPKIKNLRSSKKKTLLSLQSEKKEEVPKAIPSPKANQTLKIKDEDSDAEMDDLDFDLNGDEEDDDEDDEDNSADEDEVLTSSKTLKSNKKQPQPLKNVIDEVNKDKSADTNSTEKEELESVTKVTVTKQVKKRKKSMKEKTEKDVNGEVNKDKSANTNSTEKEELESVTAVTITKQVKKRKKSLGEKTKKGLNVEETENVVETGEEAETPESAQTAKRNKIALEDLTRRRQRDATQLLVRDLPVEVPLDELKSLSSDIKFLTFKTKQAGDLNNIVLQFDSEEKAEENLKLLQGKELKGERLRVDYMGEKCLYKRISLKTSEYTMTKLWLEYLPVDSTLTVYHIALNFPKSNCVTFLDSKGARIAIIDFPNENDACDAFENNKTINVKGAESPVLFYPKFKDQEDKKKATCEKCHKQGHTILNCQSTLKSHNKRSTPAEGNKGGFKCYNCNKEGHTYAVCPKRTQYGGSGYSNKNSDYNINFEKCNYCGGNGHFSKNCPSRRACHVCGNEGHFSSDCFKQICRNCGNKGHSMKTCSKIVCFHCSEAGHFSRECPNNSLRKCLRCGQEGHFKKFCPQLGSKNENKRKQSDDHEDQKRAKKRKFHLM